MTSRKKKFLFRSVLVLALGALIVVATRPRPVTVDIGAVSRGELLVTLDHEGKTRVRNRYVVSAPLAGRYHRIDLEPGDPVRANRTVLATYEPTAPEFLDTRSRAEAEAAVKAAEASVERAAADYRRAKAELSSAETDLRRTEQLVGQGLAPRADLDDATAKVETLREALDAADSARKAASFDVEAVRARLVEPADSQTDDSGAPRTLRLLSPIDGVVLERLHESEAVLARGESLLVLANLGDIEIVADFLSTEAVRMNPGMPVLIDRWGGDGVLRATIRRIEPSGFTKVSALGVEEQRVNVIADFDDPEEAWKSLGDAYRVEARVVVYEADNALLVPTSALFPHNGGWAVFLAGVERAELRPVTIGQRNDTVAEVVNGLAEGDPIVIYPSDDVVDGVLIEERVVPAGS